MTVFDEVDYIIPQQVNAAVEQDQTSINVIYADTDVFVLFCGMYMKKNWVGAEVYMENFNPGKTVISIRQTAERNRGHFPSLIPLHALTGCDTAPKLYGIGKAKALAALKKHTLKYVEDSSTDFEDVEMEGRSFIAQVF